jgi:CheY-like chemotaxis protein
MGITKGLLSTIFEPFEQAGGTDAKKSGTGLGLAIVKNIIDRHDGTVRVKSEEGVGSTFIVTLSEYASPEVSKRGAVQRILIVDDDYDILRLLEEGLSEYSNTRIITATSSKAAFQILEQQQCDVMIADVRMPGDMNGLDLAAQVREKYPNLKVFVMTNTPEEKERVIRTEANWIDKATPNLIHYIAKKIGREQ